jgi:acetyl-CoA carboxylase carboxyltransferase component
MSWKPEIDELKRREEFARALGGEKGVAYQHGIGKHTARERIDMLVDEGSFREFGIAAGRATYDEDGNFVEATPSNAIIGKGRIDGRKTVLSVDDFTIRGGSSEATISEKWVYAERYAHEMQLPFVRLVDTAGGSVKLLEQSGSTKIPGYPTWPVTQLLGTVPVVGVAMGACAGLGAIKVGASHFSVMVKGTSQVFAAGPPVVEAAMAQDIDKEELGGWRVQTRDGGAVDNAAEDEADALAQARRFLSYMPKNVHAVPARGSASDDPGRREAALLDIVPRNTRQVYKMRDILAMVLDRDSIFEIGRHNGPPIITCLARLDGYVVGVMANDPYSSGGAMTRTGAQKVEKFVDLCDTFHVPIVNFTDQPGVMPGLVAEKSGTIRSVLKALSAIEQSELPWVSIIVRRAVGLAGGMHGRKRSINLRFAWPSASWGSLPLEGGIRAAYRREIEAAPDPDARLAELEDHYAQFTSPFRTAEKFGVIDIIDPRETRPLLCDWIEEAHAVCEMQVGIVSRTMRP